NEYRTAEEMAFWKDNCPIALLGEKLEAAGHLTPGTVARMEGEIAGEMAAYFRFAKQSPFPRNHDWPAMNYDSHTPVADRLLGAEKSVRDRGMAVVIHRGPVVVAGEGALLGKTEVCSHFPGDLALHARDRAGREMAGGFQLLTQQCNGTVVLPERHFLSRTVFVGAVVFRADVAVPSVGIGFHEGRSGAASYRRHLLPQRAVDQDDIV